MDAPIVSPWFDLLKTPEVIKTYKGPGDDPRLKVLFEFHYAVCAGDLARVKRAITPDLDLNTLFGDDWDGYTALHKAPPNIDVFAFLLALGADPFAFSYPGHEQPLHSAVEYAQPDVVRLLLDLGADVNSTFEVFASVDAKPTTPLWLAMHSPHRTIDRRQERGRLMIEIMDILVSRGAEYPPDTQKYASWGEIYELDEFYPPIPSEDGLLVEALESESRLLWRSYLERRCAASPLGAVEASADGGIPEAHRRLLEDFGRRDDEYKGLIAAGFVHTKNPDQAWLQERVEVARVLLDSRAPLNPQDVHLITALGRHCYRGSVEFVELIPERGADATAVGHAGETPLLVTCVSRFISFETTRALIELLLKHGASLGSRAKEGAVYQPRLTGMKFVPGNTVLHSWTVRRDLGLLNYLLDAGADINAANDRGETVLMKFADDMAVMHPNQYEGQDDVAALTCLLEAGASVNGMDNQGRTVLHYLAKTCDHVLRPFFQREKRDACTTKMRESVLPCLDILARGGADPNIQDKDGKRPVSAFRDQADAKTWLGSEMAAFLGIDPEG